MQSKSTKIYQLLIILLSVAALLWVSINADDIPYKGIAILSIFAILAESLPVYIGEKTLSVSSAVTLCALISYGPIAAIWTSLFSVLFRITQDSETNKYVHIFTTSIYKTATNGAMYTLTSFASSFSYVLLGGTILYTQAIDNSSFPRMMELISNQSIYILVAIFVDMLVNTLLFAGYLHTAGKGMLFQEWVHDFFWSFAGLLVIGLLGVVLTAFYLIYGWFMVLIFFAPLFLARYTFSLYSNLRVSYMDTVKSLADAIEAKDHYTRGHSQRVQEYSALIADELKYTPKQKEVLQYAALLHDVGKIGVTETILNKPGKLDVDEFDTIKQHPEMGARIISNVKYLKECVPIIKFHHKYYDGSGYPEVGSDEKIPYESFILGVADAFDAMTSKRQYREPFSHDRAIEEIRRCAGTQFEPSVANAFIRAMESQQAKSDPIVKKTTRKLKTRQISKQKGNAPLEQPESVPDSVQP